MERRVEWMESLPPERRATNFIWLACLAPESGVIDGCIVGYGEMDDGCGGRKSGDRRRGAGSECEIGGFGVRWRPRY